MNKRLSRTTREQHKELLKFAKANSIVAVKSNNADADKLNLLWTNFARHINSKCIGPVKNGYQWRGVWTEWKSNTRRKKMQIARNRAMGYHEDRKMSDLERELLQFVAAQRSECKSQSTVEQPVSPCPSDTFDVSEVSYPYDKKHMPETAQNEDTLTVYQEDNDCEIVYDEYRDDKSDLKMLNINNYSDNNDETASISHVSDSIPQTQNHKAHTSSNKASGNKYVSSIFSGLQAAGGKLQQTQQDGAGGDTLSSESSESLSKAVRVLAESMNRRNTIELLKVKMQYLQHFHTLNGFEQFANLPSPSFDSA